MAFSLVLHICLFGPTDLLSFGCLYFRLPTSCWQIFVCLVPWQICQLFVFQIANTSCWQTYFLCTIHLTCVCIYDHLTNYFVFVILIVFDLCVRILCFVWDLLANSSTLPLILFVFLLPPLTVTWSIRARVKTNT